MPHREGVSSTALPVVRHGCMNVLGPAAAAGSGRSESSSKGSYGPCSRHHQSNEKGSLVWLTRTAYQNGLQVLDALAKDGMKTQNAFGFRLSHPKPRSGQRICCIRSLANMGAKTAPLMDAGESKSATSSRLSSSTVCNPTSAEAASGSCEPSKVCSSLLPGRMLLGNHHLYICTFYSIFQKDRYTLRCSQCCFTPVKKSRLIIVQASLVGEESYCKGYRSGLNVTSFSGVLRLPVCSQRECCTLAPDH